jgi:hypothetical protein
LHEATWPAQVKIHCKALVKLHSLDKRAGTWTCKCSLLQKLILCKRAPFRRHRGHPRRALPMASRSGSPTSSLSDGPMPDDKGAAVGDPPPVASNLPVAIAPREISEADPRASYDQAMAASGISADMMPVRSVDVVAKPPPPQKARRQTVMPSFLLPAGLLALTVVLFAGVFMLFPKPVPFETPRVSTRWCYISLQMKSSVSIIQPCLL